MILRPYSYNGTSLQSATYVADFPRASADLQMMTSSAYVKRAGATPVYAGKDYQPKTIPLEVLCSGAFMNTFEALNTLFDTKDETPRQFICDETSDSTTPSKQWYVYATPEQVLGGHDGNMATITLALDNPIWQSVTQNSQTFATTSASDSTSVTNGGNDYAYPIFEITPTSLPASDYIYNVFIQALPTSTDPWNGRFLDLTGSSDTTFDTAALVSGGKMQSDGDDLRVYRDGVEVDRWLNGMNTTDTHVIVVADMPALANMTLKTAIASTDTVTEVVLNYTANNKAAIKSMPASGRLILDSSIGSTDTEEFTYTAKTITDKKLAFTINARSVRNTTAFSFAANANVRYLPYDFTIVYGNSSATAPTVDDTYKPIIDLTSRNNSFVYSAFYESNGLRANIWNPYLRKVTNSSLARSDFYTSTNDEGDTDPATALGLAGYTYEADGAYKADTITLAWLGYFPDQIASVSGSGTQNQSAGNNLTYYLEASKDNQTWSRVWQISAQASSDYSSWTTWTKATTDATLPTSPKYLRWKVGGTIGGTVDKSDRRDITSLTVGLTNYPHIMIRTEASNVNLNLTIGNSTTGESFDLLMPVTVNETVYIDTDPDFPYVKYKGTLQNGAIKLSSIRAAWLKLNTGANTITYTSNNAGANDISIAVKWRDRLNFF